MAELGWTGDNGDPDNFFVPAGRLRRPPAPAAAVRLQMVQQGVRRPGQQGGRPSSDQNERAKLYEQAQVIMHDEAPFFLIAHSVTFQPIRKDVVNYKMASS